MTADEIKAIHAIVEGRVQGVGFRYWASTTATALRLTGWVRNKEDGSVEILCEGPEQQVDRFADRLRSGPPGAYVTGVTLRRIAPRGSYRRFSISP